MTVTSESPAGSHESDAVDRVHGSLLAANGCKLHAYRWSNRGAERSGAAVVVVMHGYGEHCQRYDEFARYLVARGHPVCGIDARGHGRSPGQRGHIDHHDQFADDLRLFLADVRERYRSRPLVLLGHSHGGLISLRALQIRKPIPDGLILCSPMIALTPEHQPVPLWLADVLARLAPRLPLPSGLRLREIIRDVQIAEATDRDPLSHTWTTPRWFSEAGHAMERAIAQLDAVTLPVLILIADRDSLVVPDALVRMAAAIPSADKEVVRFPEAYHEILNEPDRQQAYQRLAGWLSARFGAAVAA
jgi:alpha-beta hydrolase superfamily lysophospholipase